jgi:aspartyl/asparaginyl beta-hydroxylase (cupin superfamily)
MESIYQMQKAIEASWPFPHPHSTFNLSIRDLLYTLATFLVVYLLYIFNKLWLVVPILYMEPAILAFPFNVLHSLFLRTPRFFDALSLEPKLALLQDRFRDLQRETLGILSTKTDMPFFADVSKHQQRIAGNQPWRVFPFYAYGHVNEENCQRAPVLTSILRQIPSVRLAMLSMMEEGAEIPLHCGFFKSVLRVHLCLWTDYKDTEQKRYIEVGGEKYSWKEGELVAFDDTYPHRVYNAVKGRRVVLFLDIDRPYQTQISSLVGKALLYLMKASPSVKSHAALQEKVEHFEKK